MAYERIDIAALPSNASRELANALLDRIDATPDALRNLVVDGAEGNPFYIEEIVRMLIDDQVKPSQRASRAVTFPARTPP